MSTCTYLEVVSIYLGKYVSCSMYLCCSDLMDWIANTYMHD